MARAALPLCLAALSAAAALASPAPRALSPNLIGATANVTDLSAYPFAVRLIGGDGEISACTGVLVSPKWVLTSGNCAFGMYRGGKLALYHNVLKATTQAQGGTLYEAGAVFMPRAGDIGMVQLGRKIFDGGKPLLPAAWNRDPALPAPGTDVQVLGFGLTRLDPDVDPQNLQLFRSKVAAVANCTQVDPDLGRIDPVAFMCVKAAGVAAVCAGDPGAFALATVGGKPTVLGVTTFRVDGCATASADSFFIRTSLRADFIESTLMAVPIQQTTSKRRRTTSKRKAATSTKKAAAKSTAKKRTTTKKKTTTKRRATTKR
ncbi:trypsin-like cysteine/serine peptidase domain-containing protein [Hyaloraphidium curvatum]|nr:trypsin-like cysteine/serine peptidase domain-containing protein [Hyaloraphidium curvatum]